MKANSQNPKDVGRPAIAPGLLGYVMNIISNITIEPAYFLISLASGHGGIDDIIINQITIHKSCKVDFGYNDTVCENLVTDYREENEEIQNEVAQFIVYKMIVGTFFPVFFSFYLGAWCDLFGRKLIFKLYLSAKCVEQIIVIVCAYYLESPKEWLLLAPIPTALAGGMGGMYLATNSFIADISSEKYRAFRYGMLHLAGSLARPIAPIIGAYLLSFGTEEWSLKYGYVLVFSTSLASTALGAILLFWRIRSYKWVPEKKEVSKSAFSIQHPIECIKTTFKKREGPNRKYILIFMIMLACTIMPFIGEGTVAYNYVRTRFEWEYEEYSEYSSITNAISIVGQAVLIPLIAFMGVNESLVMCAIFFSISARHFIKAFAYEPWLYYVGACVDIIGPYGFQIVKAMSTNCVTPYELGKINALLSAIDSLMPAGISQIYASLWKVTSTKFPGAVFLVSTGISSISFLLAIYVHFSLKGKRIAEVTRKGADRLTDEEKEDKRILENRKFSPESFDNAIKISHI